MTSRPGVTVVLCALVGSAALISAAPQGKGVRRASKPVHDHYIVVLAPDEDGESVGRDAERQHGGRLNQVYRRALRGFAMRLSVAAAEKLADDPRVLFVEEDGFAYLTQAAPTWGLDRIDQRGLPLDNLYLAGATGLGIAVHVLDTGIRATHTEFGGRAHIAGDYIGDGRPYGVDCHGHGTHVAGTIGGITYGVAKNVDLYAHRVLDCNGAGTNSRIIAAIDAVVDHPQRPAVINMSLSGSPSDALDAAVDAAVSAGVTTVVAAGNSNIDASNESPARAVAAITVGASGATDARASFSNFGSVLDLFAPGVSVVAAWHTSDTATKALSGTSMATPHVAGAAALHLEQYPLHTPQQVAEVLTDAATPDVVAGAGPGSPNRLLFVGTATPVTVTIASPNGAERVFGGSPYRVEWTTSDTPFTRFDVEFSSDGGSTFAPASGCSGVTGSERFCMWTPPPGATSKAHIKVMGRVDTGVTVQDRSNAVFTVTTGVPSVKVTQPTTVLNWGLGSVQEIKWSHNLGTNAFVRITLSRDGGATFGETLAVVKNTASSSGTWRWTVSGPNTAAAIVRVAWAHGTASDTSDVAFKIADPSLTLTSPASSTVNWGFGTVQRVKWTSNLGRYATVSVQLSTDGGATFPVVLATATASTGSADVNVPTLPTPTTAARVRVIWLDGSPGVSIAATPSFTIAAPAITVTSPNGGGALTSGLSTTIKWTSNLGSLETVRVELSTDDGASWSVVLLAATASDGSQKVVVNSAWIAPAARVRITWTRDSAVSDTSNSAFTIR